MELEVFAGQEKNELSMVEVARAILEERGYDAMTQLVGYLMSGDPGYITSHKEARNMIMRYDRSKILEFLIHHYMEHK